MIHNKSPKVDMLIPNSELKSKVSSRAIKVYIRDIVK